MEKIKSFVEDIPSDVLAFHGGTEKLTKMLTDLLFPHTEDVSEQPKKRGRPVGSKNKPKDDLPEITDTPKKRGRPVGSKNKPKESDVSKDITVPKKRGRPAGSKNKNPKDVSTATEVTKTPNKRGRPLGSKNKPKPTDVSKEIMVTPKKQSTKNKPKTPGAPTKPSRKPDKYTRKSKKSTAAAEIIQRAWRASK